MTYLLYFLPELEEDAVAGYAWYEEKSPGLGQEFMRLFYACSMEISRNPFLSAQIHNDFRRRLLRRFPYVVYYRIEGDCVIIAGLFHCARDTEFIQESIDRR